MEEFGLDEDSLPEHCQYQDEGCDLFPSCLGCPLPCCRYDERRQVGKRLRDREIQRQRLESKSITELAQKFGLSRRTIHRILRRA